MVDAHNPRPTERAVLWLVKASLIPVLDEFSADDKLDAPAADKDEYSMRQSERLGPNIYFFHDNVGKSLRFLSICRWTQVPFLEN